MSRRRGEEKEFYAIARRYFDKLLWDIPVYATSLGIHKYDHILSRYCFSDLRKRDKKRIKKILQRLSKMDKSKFSPEGMTDYQIFKADLASSLRWLDSRLIGRDPIVNIDFIIDAVYALVILGLEKRKNRLNIIKRLKAIPEDLKIEAKDLKNPPTLWIKMCCERVEHARFFFDDVFKMLSEHTKTDKDKAELDNIHEKINEALTAYWASVKRFKGKRRVHFAAGRKELSSIIKEDYFLPYSIDEIEHIARIYVKRIKSKLTALAQKNGYGNDWHKLHRELLSKFNDRGLVGRYRRFTKNIRAKIAEKKLFPLPQKDSLIIEETPRYLIKELPLAAYMSAGPYERNPQARFFVTKRPGNNQDHTGIVITAAHEGYPGHHLQLGLARENRNWFRKLFADCALFVEGWGFYSEELVGELGMARGLKYRFMKLIGELWRAERVLIDIGLHTRKMSVSEAISILERDIKFLPDTIRDEVYRYTTLPGYQLAYFIGKLEIKKFRDECLRDGMTLKEFHELILSYGSIPVTLMREEYRKHKDKMVPKN